MSQINVVSQTAVPHSAPVTGDFTPLSTHFSEFSVQSGALEISWSLAETGPGAAEAGKPANLLNVSLPVSDISKNSHRLLELRNISSSQLQDLIEISQYICKDS